MMCNIALTPRLKCLLLLLLPAVAIVIVILLQWQRKPVFSSVIPQLVHLTLQNRSRPTCEEVAAVEAWVHMNPGFEVCVGSESMYLIVRQNIDTERFDGPCRTARAHAYIASKTVSRHACLHRLHPRAHNMHV